MLLSYEVVTLEYCLVDASFRVYKLFIGYPRVRTLHVIIFRVKYNEL